MATAKHSMYTTIIDYQVKRLVQDGHLRNIKKSLGARKPTCKKVLVKAIGLEKCGILMLGLLFFMATAVLLLMTEKIFQGITGVEQKPKSKVIKVHSHGIPNMKIVRELNKLSKEDFISTMKSVIDRRKQRENLSFAISSWI